MTNTPDIVERIRERDDDADMRDLCRLIDEAANEIMKLRAALEVQKEANRKLADSREYVMAEYDKLRLNQSSKLPGHGIEETTRMFKGLME